jgi:hypothetical protein
MQTSHLAALLLTTRPAADNHQGVTLQREGRQQEAADCFRRALAVRPDYADALNNLALAWQAMGQLDRALSLFERALAVTAAPQLPALLNNLGLALHQSGRPQEAAICFRDCLALAPGHLDANHNLAIALLQSGQYRQGWEHFEQRQRRPGESLTEHRRFSRPQWTGEPALGRTLLLWGEQGYGDQIQFVRYVPLAVQRGWHVVLEVPGPLTGLFAGLQDVTLVARGAPLPRFDLHCPLLSLPRAFATELASIPAEIPYLSAEPARVEAWRRRLPAGGFRVGIAWQGNPAARAERGRSAPLACFAPLAACPGVTLISLQKYDGLEQLEALPPGMAVTTLGEDFDAGPHALLDSAAVMMSLDLVISVDSVIGHLAGALGRPVWLALQAVPHWVWLTGRADSPWYPNARLFRQDRPGDWPELFARMAVALRATLAGRHLS